MRPVQAFDILLILSLTFFVPGHAASLADQIQDRLRRRLEISAVEENLSVGRDLVHAEIALPIFYERRNFAPAWSITSGPVPQADSLVAALAAADRQGLRPNDYHYRQIVSLLARWRQNAAAGIPADTGLLVDLDLLMTDAFLIYASHLVSGRVNPFTIDPEWFTELREADLINMLEVGLMDNTIGATLESLLPRQAGYARMVAALAQYRKVAAEGGWPGIPTGKKLEKGVDDQRVSLLRRRLILGGDLTGDISEDLNLFDDSLRVALKRFQHRHGLEPDGVAGPKTLEALNVSVEQRIIQLTTNLERWRWLPQTLGERYIIVNIAGYELDVIENGTVVLPMRVIVGKAYHRTPVFTDSLRYLVLNPYWNVPTSIAIKEILPKLRKDSSYLAAEDMELLKGFGSDRETIDPTTVNWKAIKGRYFPYWIRQRPGPTNPLGKIKFMFPNRFNVYLHDTSERNLFARADRSFSLGCVRIEKPLELAYYLMQGSTAWTPAALDSALQKVTDQSVRLPRPIPIHILYWTAWVDNSGLVNFRPDIYDRDRALQQALSEAPPSTDNPEPHP